MDFVAIDFETANETRASACSIGLAFVRDNKIVDTKYFLIKPPELRFNWRNVRIHGITEKDVINEPEFNELWPVLKVDLENRTLVAHNAAFDMFVLKDMLDQYQLPHPESTYCCSVKISQKVWPDIENHKLNTLAAHFGIEFTHHNAVEDAVACARLIIRACEDKGACSIDELAKLLGIQKKDLNAPPKIKKQKSRKSKEERVTLTLKERVLNILGKS